MITDAQWITPGFDCGDAAVLFERRFEAGEAVSSASLTVTAMGVYDVYLNGQRVDTDLLAPGCTAYDRRLQYQQYDVKPLLRLHNTLQITVGKGWCRSRMTAKRAEIHALPCAMIAEMVWTDADGARERLITDGQWRCGRSNVIFNDMWDGETCDATLPLRADLPVRTVEMSKEILLPQEGPSVREQAVIRPLRLFTAPNGEKILDFGQEITGYAAIDLDAPTGSRISLSCGEMLDRNGNFYNANYRTAKSRMTFVCQAGLRTYQPRFTFYGFRYIRVDEFPGEVDPAAFWAVAIYSQMRQTGWVESSHPGLNRLFQNVLWSQRGNFVDIPTDCPQRDERMGWTGDAQVFALTACYNYRCKQFFEKWLGDLRAEQRADGSIPDTVPNFWGVKRSSAAWGDVITVLPWQLYRMFGDQKTLEKNFDAMRRWVDYITADTQTPYLWTAPDDSALMWQKHYGDWLALDAVDGSYRGSTPNDFIASAFYAHSTDLLIQAGHALGRDMRAYESLYQKILQAFRKAFPVLTTQTEHVLALVFHLTDSPQAVADSLADMIRGSGCKLKTGFVGTPYLLHALSANGHTALAYDLLLQEEYPSWLYEVNHGATTVWEHWDGRKPDGSFWSTDMNSFNHYAYGSVMDWVYSVAGGIRPDEEHPGFARAVIAPHPTRRIAHLQVTYESIHGPIRSSWTAADQGFQYEIETSVPATVLIGQTVYNVSPGIHIFHSAQ